MEALSTAASVLTVLQLVRSVQELYEFWVSVEDAPDEVQSIVIDLKLLANALTEIACEAQHAEVSVTLVEAIENCAAKVETLIGIVDELKPDFASASITVRRWAAVKSVVRGARIKKFMGTLESLKSTLMLVQQCQDRYGVHSLINKASLPVLRTRAGS